MKSCWERDREMYLSVIWSSETKMLARHWRWMAQLRQSSATLSFSLDQSIDRNNIFSDSRVDYFSPNNQVSCSTVTSLHWNSKKLLSFSLTRTFKKSFSARFHRRSIMQSHLNNRLRFAFRSQPFHISFLLRWIVTRVIEQIRLSRRWT